MATRKRRVRDDSTKSLGQITRRWMKRSSTGRAVLNVIDAPKKVKKAVRKLKKGR